MKKRIWLLYIFSLLIVCGMVAISYFVIQKPNSDNSLQLKIEKIDKLNEEKLEFTSAYNADTTTCTISEDLTSDGFIELSTFSELTGSIISGTIVEKSGFSFDITINDYTVKEVENKVVVNLDVIATELGYDIEYKDNKYLLNRTFASKRLLVDGGFSENYGADATFKYDNLTLLQYNISLRVGIFVITRVLEIRHSFQH